MQPGYRCVVKTANLFSVYLLHACTLYCNPGLRKYSGYQAAIASMTAVGTGPFFTTRNVTTFEDGRYLNMRNK